MHLISRRDFLKLGGAMLAGLLSPPARSRWALADAPFAWEPKKPPAAWGRSILWRQAVRSAPLPDAEWVAWKYRNDVMQLQAAVVGEGPWPSNPVWYQINEGYIHSGYVQPVENEPQYSIVSSIPENGIWVEACVPVIKARWQPGGAYVAKYLYYGTIYRVVAAQEDEGGAWWYQLQEGITYSPGPWAPAWSMRPLAPSDLMPISPGREDKWIEIDLQTHVLTCLEGETPVYTSPFASGIAGTRTPLGDFRVILKRKTRRMIGGEDENYYDLPGIAFPVYFTGSGVAIHGTYWHNDFCRPHSHGCVNVPNDTARWVYRWVDPAVPYNVYSHTVEAGQGTPVKVVYGSARTTAVPAKTLEGKSGIF